MKGTIRAILGAATVCACFAFAANDVNAATGIYVGKDVSADDSMLVGVTLEYGLGSAGVPVIIEKGTIRKGDVIESQNGFKYTMPEDNEKVLLQRLMKYVGIGEWNTCASNEYGVSVLSGITTDPCIEAVQADTFAEDGVCEDKIPLILAATSKSAKDAVRTLCSLYEESGACAAETVLIADQEGAWIVENFTGHQYVATRLPDDKIAVFSNEPVIRTVDPDDKDTIVSSDLFTLPEKNGFAVYDDDKNIDLILSYTADNKYCDECHLREWAGHNVFAPSEALAYDEGSGFDLFFTPDDKVTLDQAFDLFRYRYEGTDYDLSKEGNDIHYGINNQFVANANVIQIFDDVPAALSTVLWTTPANQTASPFIPIPVHASTIPESFSTDIEDDEYVDGILQNDFAKLNNGVYQRRQLYGGSIRQYWEGMESVSATDVLVNIHKNWKDVSDEEAVKQIDDFVAKVVEGADENCIRLNNELEWYLFRNGIRKQSVPDEELDPFECSFDAVSFARENGWETNVANDVFTAEKDGKKI
ncbi:MAG: C69 family dipeptidase, partial [Lachnospiraceae bacterium]|nr:C69 family dipeptidase [Lachnospiraceae bacterium]